jgi:hypothetical protein
LELAFCGTPLALGGRGDAKNARNGNLMLPPPSPHLDNPPILSGRVLKACGHLWSVELLGMWAASETLMPNIDLFCRLNAVSTGRVHTVMVEVDRLYFHLISPSEAILRSLERAIDCDPMPSFVKLGMSKLRIQVAS